MTKKYFLLFFSIFLLNSFFAQIKLSETAEIGIITAGPGKALYEKFGHSAIRIKDPAIGLDVIYNYGIFDFNQPNFYTNFAQGKMYYLLAKYDFKYFLNSYRHDKRWVKQQVLNVSQKEKQAFFNYLEKNTLKENATYLYDPFFNNCATKLRDITKIAFQNKIDFNPKTIPEKQSLRFLMNKELHWNSWGNFGINLIAGTILDKERKITEYMYLPDYVHALFKEGKILGNTKNQNLVKREDVLLDYKENTESFSIFSPVVIFSALFIFVLWTTFRNKQTNQRNKYLDFILLFTNGLLGFFLLYLWLFSSHITAPNNFNILWAFAPNLFIAFLTLQKTPKKWLPFYFKGLVVLLVCVGLLWILNIQVFALTNIPILLLIFVRYLYLSKHYYPL
ncbi:DUF4105 domain-containing protein [uncultured Polaribacter sp.]|uniref:lipoprotein N-acyltransferase Lnb domain-containing protein n=1 Tax=uncultured Polaribacter sp. TaxID=174711 RepID=UPI00263108B8|nr:DUF4105 domain-containing protein [uncultured Polaribacter sp.]